MKIIKLTIIFFLLVVFTTAHFASDTAVDGIYYNFDNTNLTAKVTYKGAEDDWMYDSTGEQQYVGILNIPETVIYNGNTYTVIGFDTDALIGSKLLEILVIPATVTSFGSGVFTSCNSLHTIYIDEDNPNFFMYDRVMYKRNPVSLFFVPRAISGEVELHNEITTIPSGAFQGTRITDIVIPENVTTIKDGAFNRCSQLRNITIGRNVMSIARDAFSYCTSLQEIEIPSSVKTIATSAFSSCDYLSNVILNEGLESIGSYAFSRCLSLRSISLPSTLNLIENQAFFYCNSLKTVINASDLDIQAGATTHGSVARYATEVIKNTVDLEDVCAKNNIEIFTSEKSIVVLNAKNQVINIYNILGECVYSEKTNSDKVTIPISHAGIHIVRTNNFSKKVILK